VGLLVVGFGIYFSFNPASLAGGTIAFSVLVVSIAAMLMGLGGGVVVALLLWGIQVFFLTRSDHVGMLELLNGDFLVNLVSLLACGTLVGIMHSVILQSQREAEERRKSDEARGKSELRFRTMADLTYDWEAWEDPAGQLIYMSPSVLRFTGYPPEAFEKNPDLLMELTLEEDQPALQTHFDAAVGENPLQQIDFRLRHKDGRIVWLRHICQPVYDAKGAFQGRRASNLDITEISLANEALKLRLELEHLISEISSSFIDTPDADINTNLHASLQKVAEFMQAERAFLFTFAPNSLTIEDLFQWSLDDSELKSIQVGMDLAEYPWISAHIHNDQVLQVRSPADLPPEAAKEREHWKVTNAASLLALPLILDGKPIGVYGFSMVSRESAWQDDDIRTLHLLGEIYANLIGRLRVKNELLNSELRFRSTFENAGIGIGLLSEDSRLLDANPVMCEMFGYTREELIGRSTDELTHPEDRRIDYGMVMDLVKSKAPSVQREIRYYRSDGRLFWGRLTISLVRSQVGRSVYGIVMLEDITEQRQISEELLRRERILEAVSLAAEDLLRVSDWEAGVQRALAALGSASQAYHVCIYQLDETDSSQLTLHPTASWRREEDGSPRAGDWGQATLHASKDNAALQTLRKNRIFKGTSRQFPADPTLSSQELPAAQLLIVPVFIEDQLWGLVCFISDQDSVWFAAEEEGLKIAANLFGAAFQRRQGEKQIEQLYQAEHDQRRMAEALRNTAETLNASLDLDEVFAQVLENVEKVVPIDAANIMLIEDGVIRVVGARGYEERNVQEHIMKLHYRVADYPNLNTMYEKGVPVLNSSVGDNPKWVPDPNFDWIRSFAGAPIRQDGRTVGFLNVDSVTPDLFTQVHANRLQVFADQASLAIRNAGLFDEAQRRTKQIALLHQMAQAAISASTQSEMLDHMVNTMRALFDGDNAAILLFDKVGQYPNVAAIVGEATRLKGQISNAELAGFLRVETPMVIEDLSKRPDVKSAAALLHPCRALLTLPMVLDENRLGMVLVGFKKTRRITPAEVSLGEQAALQVALGFSKSQLLESERSRTRQLARANGLFSALDHVATRIGEAADSSGVIKTLETELARLDLSYAIALADSNTGEMLLQYYSFLSHPDWRDRHSEVARLFDQPAFKQPLGSDSNYYYIPDPMRMAQELALNMDPETVRTLIRLAGFTHETRMFLLPLIVKDRSIGVLAVWGSALQESDRIVMSTFASQIAVAFYNASLYEQIQRVAITDDMTGLFNRRGMHEFGEREVERARRFSRPLSALMLDLDLFSRINDTYGHLVGDEVLRLLADRVRDNIRELDVPVRFGGEEFLILLVETNAQEALLVAERIRQAIASSPFATSIGPLRVTTSIGVAEMTPEMGGITHLIARADQALYRAKEAGRNRVMADGVPDSSPEQAATR
jgi:diguanylate cyclase (GGDEF)-like protein/PAS domain S-box-containing protein